jgi:NAD(P)-dependent dehydrogenase (short-subunit alcohol dehydrogenase family)
MSQAVAVVVGVGPGLGAAVAKRFAREGFAVGLVARNRDKLEPVAKAIDEAGGRSCSVSADATSESSLSEAFDTIRKQLGHPTVLVYNAGAFHMGGVMETEPSVFEGCWKANCMGAFLCAREVLPKMLEDGSGTILLTGATAALRGGGRFSAFAVGKFGLRALAQSMARELGPEGIHVAHVVIDGMIDTPRTRSMFGDRDANHMLQPNAIADSYWQLHTQHPSCWTQELDVRPHVEDF